MIDALSLVVLKHALDHRYLLEYIAYESKQIRQIEDFTDLYC